MPRPVGGLVLEEEISLKEIFAALWQGRYIIIGFTLFAMVTALVVSLLFTTTKYEAKAMVDLSPFGLSSAALVSSVQNHNHLEYALQDLSDDPRTLASKVSIVEQGSNVEITATTSNPELSAKTADRVGIYIAEKAVETLLSQRETLQLWLEYFEEQYETVYSDYFEHNDPNLLQTDPAYMTLMNEKGRRLLQLHELEFQLQGISDIIEGQNSNHFYPATVPGEPANVRWPLNTAVAGVLGLMLSVLIVFIKPHFHELTTDLKENSKKDT